MPTCVASYTMDKFCSDLESDEQLHKVDLIGLVLIS